MSGTQDSFGHLEENRLRLEGNANQLRRLLQHWQTWDAEYEALKEEVEAVQGGRQDSQASRLQEVRDGFQGELLHGKELDDVFGTRQPRPAAQIVDVLQRRIDYVSKTIETLTKQLRTAEDEYDAAAVVSQADASNENGQPVTEIIEELDDDDNVLSYRLSRPGDAIPQVREALEQAGVKSLPDPEAEPMAGTSHMSAAPANCVLGQDKSEWTDGSEKTRHPASAPTPKKTVSFSEHVPMEDAPLRTSEREPQMSRQARRVEQIMKTAKEQEKISKGMPVIPDDEDEEDAALRRQMLNYSMGEVGAVVAELQLEEGDADYDDAVGFGYDDEGFDESLEDDEDKWGRSTGQMVSDDYRQRMLELEQRLGIASRFTEAARQDEEKGEDSSDDGQGIGRVVVKRSETAPSASKPAPPKSNLKSKQINGDEQKGVRFAQNLDIAPDDGPAGPSARRDKGHFVEPLGDIVERHGPSKADGPAMNLENKQVNGDEKGGVRHAQSLGTMPNDWPAAPAGRRDKGPFVEPIGDIVERCGPSQADGSSAMPRQQSRFKQARVKGTSSGGIPRGPLDAPRQFLERERREPPTGPDGATLADILVEREPASSPAPPGEHDDFLDHNAVADEYHRLRKKFIQRQGGFLREEETPTLEPGEADEPQERVSRFKAARLSRQ